jgi:DNA modification methylase
MKRVLKDSGTIYLQCDWHLVHYLKVKIYYIFGINNFVNEIIWAYDRWTNSSKSFTRCHDNILFYSKDINNICFNLDDMRTPFTPHKQDKSQKNYGGRMGIDEDGRPYVEKWGTGNKKLYRYYLDIGKILDDVWEDVNSLQSRCRERSGYDTQKPLKLMERIIKASSNEGDTVADFFCGSGSFGIKAKQLNRNYILCDINPKAIEITNQRLNSAS